MHVRVIADAGSNVGVQAEHLARRHIEALEAAALRSRNGGLQENLGSLQRLERAGCDSGGDAAQVDLLADLDGLGLNLRSGFLQDVERGGHNFRADAVAVRDSDRCFRCHGLQNLQITRAGDD